MIVCRGQDLHKDMTTKSDRTAPTQNGSARGAEPLPPAAALIADGSARGAKPLPPTAALIADGSSSTDLPDSGEPPEDVSRNGESTGNMPPSDQSTEPASAGQRSRTRAELAGVPGSLGKTASSRDDSDEDDSDEDDSDDDDSDDENRADDAVQAERDPRRPAFLDELADIAELRPLVAAFVGGNYARLRQLERALPRQTSDPETLALARELVERTQPDPLSKAILGISVLFFLFIVGWVYLHHAQ